MKLRIQAVLLLLLAIVMASCAGSETSIQTQNQNIDPQPTTSTDALLKYQDAISVDYMRNHLTVFASDSLQGRETGTPGEEMAADFLAREYEKLGLKPVGDDGTYFQHFKLNATKTDSIVFGLYNTANEQKELVDRSTASKNSVGNFVRQFGGSDSLRGQIVFAGFGVNDPAHNVSNLNGADLKGKWVMVFQSIPHVANGDTLINPSIDARARFQSIMQQGAAGIGSFLLKMPIALRQWPRRCNLNSEKLAVWAWPTVMMIPVLPVDLTADTTLSIPNWLPKC